MAAVTALMDEIAAVIDDILGPGTLGNDGFSVTGRLNLDPAIPAVDVYPADPFITQDIRGFQEPATMLNFVVRARVNGDERGRQDVLLTLMDPDHENCVAVALEDDQTLNGLATSVVVDGPSGYVQYADSGGVTSHIGCEWRVRIPQLIT